MRVTIASVRLICFALLLLFGLAIAFTLRISAGRTWYSQPFGAATKLYWMRMAAWILGLRLQKFGVLPEKGAIWVANHISWLDAVALSTLSPVSFIAKSDVRKWPIVGQLAALSGTLFIDRSARRAVSISITEAREVLNTGISVAFFPEATTTDGHRLHPFKPALFATANADTRVQAITLRYQPSHDGSENAPFIGNDTFIAHLWRVLRTPRGIRLELIFCPAIVSADRKLLAQQTQKQIREVLEVHTQWSIEQKTAMIAAHAASEFGQ
ncbi:MAG: 1-acyl-sn-glycerol-3-phosphate acyltransferase [Gammaproteobacteria bacterium]|nr:1-acyl-sn-glycerol-3-phosphate acyltransferase [Gammaproteobacteria bacterium]